MENPTERIAEFIASTTFDQISEDSIKIAKMQIADYSGVAIAGSLEDESRIIRDIVLEKTRNQTGPCTIFGTSFQAHPDDAALINGVQAHVLDYDDVSQTMYGHPSAAILPAVFAVSEKRRCGGKALLEGFIIGGEVAAKVGGILNPEHYKSGWHATCTLGSIGAAAGVAKMLKMNKTEIRKVLGIASSFSSGLKQNFGTPMKSYHAGRAAESGVRAATLVQRGWSADERIFDRESGFFRAYCPTGTSNLCNFQISFNKPFDIIQPGIILKKYPSCGFTHPAIDAALEIYEELTPPPTEICEIKVGINKMASDALNYQGASNGLEGKFSVEYCVASALLRGGCRLADFTTKNVMQKEVQDLVNKVQRTIIPKPEGFTNIFGPSEVRVVYRNGAVFSKKVEIARGDPGRPLSESERFSKYQDCLAAVYGDETIHRTFELIEGLEDLSDVGKLTVMFQESDKI